MTQKAVFNLNLLFKKELTLILKPDLTKIFNKIKTVQTK